MNRNWIGRQIGRVICSFLIGMGTLTIAYMVGIEGYGAAALAALLTISFWCKNP